MDPRSKNARMKRYQETLKAQGWLEEANLKAAALTPEDLPDFIDALSKISRLLSYQLGEEYQDHFYPDKSSRLVQMAIRLRDELHRVSTGAHSPLLYQKPGTKINKNGSDPEVRNLICLIGLYERYCSDFFRSPNALHTHLSDVISRNGLKRSVRQIGKDIEHFKEGASGRINRRNWIRGAQKFRLEHQDSLLRTYSPEANKQNLERQIVDAVQTIISLDLHKRRSD